MAGVVSSPPNPEAGGPPAVGCLCFLIQYICSYSPYLEIISSIRNLRMCHAMVIGDPLYMVPKDCKIKIHKTIIIYQLFLFSNVVTLPEEHKLQVSENIIPRKIFVPKQMKYMREFGILPYCINFII
jgi:hypothetical protein